jgi:hypothetical protein
MTSTRTLKRLAAILWGTCLLLILGFLLYQSKLVPKAISILIPPTATASPTATLTQTATDTPTSTFTNTLTPSLTFTPTETYTPTPSPTSTDTPTFTPLPYASGSIVIGTSVAGRPIEAYRFGTGPVERLIVHGIHGGSEYNTIALADQLIAEYTDHPERIPAGVTLYIVRSLNPDGEAREHGPNGRVNDHGVDLNRNSDAYWQKTWNRNGCWEETTVTGGSYPFSEPETQAIRDFIFAHYFSALIVYHSSGGGIFVGGQPPGPNSVRLARAIADISNYQYPFYSVCQITGDLSDWGVLQGIPSVVIELHTNTNTDFAINLQVLEMFLKWS